MLQRSPDLDGPQRGGETAGHAERRDVPSTLNSPHDPGPVIVVGVAPTGPHGHATTLTITV
eukprot:4542357-Alexandrium_andersonii.AAC.1